MNKSELTIINYKEVLEAIKDQENYLLIGNGFNRGLGINTGYGAIFQKMIENNCEIYKDALTMVKECESDLEKFIEKLEKDVNPENLFLRKYVKNKVKFDFMQATHKIVKSEIKSIYAEKNEGVFLLLKEFTQYFTLNYDSFLYLFLLKHKSTKDNLTNAIVLKPSLKFMSEDLNKRENNIYSEIKQARENGKLEFNFGSEETTVKEPLNMISRDHFIRIVREFSRKNNKGWKAKDIKRVVKSILEEEKRNAVINRVDDGSKQIPIFDDNIEFVYDANSETQNLFFLHGAFHIYKDGKDLKRITQSTDKALYDKLEEVLNDENQEVVCIFQSDKKIEAINQNEYLKNCLEKLGNVSGNMVIVGCSLDDNDDHIYEQIKNSNVKRVFVSSLLKNAQKIYAKARSKFPSKEIIVFNAESISYELPEEIAEGK